jgi:hypothetical protein
LAPRWRSRPSAPAICLVDEFASRFVYFYAGYALAGYAFALADKATARPMVGLMGLFAWGVINAVAVFTDVHAFGQTYSIAQLPFLSLALGAMGALAVITTAALVTRTLVGRGFSYMGARSIVIYLAFFLPMVVVREVGFRLGLVPDTGILALITTLIAVVSPLMATGSSRRLALVASCSSVPRGPILTGRGADNRCPSHQRNNGSKADFSSGLVDAILLRSRHHDRCFDRRAIAPADPRRSFDARRWLNLHFPRLPCPAAAHAQIRWLCLLVRSRASATCCGSCSPNPIRSFWARRRRILR